uniref:1-acyl-sn-glycerol-3-phosphate acyltransferase n=1 Tax=Dicentrarchus labrax TaxID=13489 RepID=A0A8C4HJM3_DICLA
MARSCSIIFKQDSLAICSARAPNDSCSCARTRRKNPKRIIRSMVRHVKYFLGLRFEVTGWEHLQTEGPYVIISNHQSSLDVLGLMEILPDRCTMIAKKELIYAGTVGLICWLGGIVFINRKKTSDAKSVMADAAKTMLDEQIRLWVFPEGTRNQKGDLLPFKKGAFHLAVQAQVPIIPVVFSSYSSFYLRKEKQFNSGTITLKILPKIETKGMTSEDISSLSDKCFNVMRSAFLNISESVTQSNGPLRH